MQYQQLDRRREDESHRSYFALKIFSCLLIVAFLLSITVSNSAFATTESGATVDALSPLGSYTSVSEAVLVSNINYTLIYDDSVTIDMPTDQNTDSATKTITLSNNVPTRDGYTFNGWCTVSPVVSQYNDTCSGSTYAAGATYTLDETAANNIRLYAMWKRNTMQNVSEWGPNLTVGSETTAIDTRDGKTYSVARLCMAKTNNECTSSNLWMTQNLDLLVGGAGVGNLTSLDSDINSDLGSAMGYSTSDNVITWTPATTLNVPAVIINHAVGTTTDATVGWDNSNIIPYQAEGGEYYIFTSNNNSDDAIYASLSTCVNNGHTIKQCSHYHVGNYYNWSAAVAGNDTSSYTADLTVMENSICPKGWRLPNGLTGATGSETISEFNQLTLANGITNGQTTAHSSESDRYANAGWATNGFNNFRSASTNSVGNAAPLYFVRPGLLVGSVLYYYSTGGGLWSSTVRSDSWSYRLGFNSGVITPAYQDGRHYGFPVRCIAR